MSDEFDIVEEKDEAVGVAAPSPVEDVVRRWFADTFARNYPGDVDSWNRLQRAVDDLIARLAGVTK